ncbi:hypothetical protein [Cupriavidus sp. IDO]|uniref:hypothetical protein n=1 Tax=Cupriavidus sp. IDO TaxID=1539142 RepID=UPI0009E2F0BA|nr:hypothetical protein [Cupriavidus sp. IDO]
MSMKHLLLFLVSISLIPISSAGELSDSDAGTYELLKEDRTPSGVLYRFTRSGNKWVVFGKLPAKDWKDVSCDSGCEYRISTKREIQAYFPPDWRESNEIACIQNIALAFCRFSPVNAPGRNGYIFFALVTGKPIPMRTRRLN